MMKENDGVIIGKVKKGDHGERVIKGLDACGQDRKVLVLSSEGADEIAPEAFAENCHLEQVFLLGHLKIGRRAFARCKEMRRILFAYHSDRLKEIPDGFAEGCGKLKCLALPNVEKIGKRAFYGCESLETVVLPPTLKEIGEKAFFQCPSLQTVVSLADPSLDLTWAVEGARVIHVKDGLLKEGKWQAKIEERLMYKDENQKMEITYPHLRLFRYSGFDEYLEIPESISGLPVLRWEPDLFHRGSSIKAIDWRCDCYWIADAIDISQFPREIRSITLPPVRNLVRSQARKEGITLPQEEGHSLMGWESKLESVWLPEGLEVIGEATFHQYRHLRSVEFPSSLKTIEKGAFDGCVSLEKIVFRDSPVEIKESAFLGCSSLKRVEFGSRLRSIGPNAFKECPLLKKVGIPKETKVHDQAFKNVEVICRDFSALAPGKAYLPVGGGACLTYTVLRQPEERAVILSVIPGKTGEVVVPGRIDGFPVTALGDGAAAFREGLEKLVLPETIEEIGELGIYGCPDLKVIALEHVNSAPRLYTEAVGQNPSAVVCVKNETVLRRLRGRECGCRIFLLEGTADRAAYTYNIETGALDISGDRQMKSYRDLDASREEGDSTAPWSCMQKSIRSITLKKCSAVGAYAFRGLEKLEWVSFPSGLLTIGSYAFADCPNLREVRFPDSLTKIYSHAFYNCGKLKAAVFNERLELIGSHSFFKTALEKLTIPKGIKTLGTSAFMECRSLKEIYLKSEEPFQLGSTGSPVNTVFCNVAEDCRVYTKIPRFTSLDNNCNHTTLIIAPEGSACGRGVGGEISEEVSWKLDYDGLLRVRGREDGKEYAMMDCRDVTSPWTEAAQPIKQVRIEKNVTEIGACAFFSCEMEKLFLEGTRVIGEQAFARCGKLEEIRLPATLKRVEAEAFAYMEQMERIIYEGTKEQFLEVEWGRDVFSMSGVPVIRCEDGMAVCPGSERGLRLEYRLFREPALNGAPFDGAPAERNAGLGVEWIEIDASDWGEAADCLEKTDCASQERRGENGAERLVPAVPAPAKNGRYYLGQGEGTVLAALSLRLKPRYAQAYRIGYRLCAGERGWTEWRWDGETAAWKGQDSELLPATDVEIRIEEKRCWIPEQPVLCYRAGSGKNQGELVLDGKTAQAGPENIENIWLTAMLNGDYSDCLECTQHLQYLGDSDVTYKDRGYVFGRGKHRLEAVCLKVKGPAAGCRLRYRVKLEGKQEKDFWQEWKNGGEWAGTKGESRGIKAVAMEMWRD